MKKKTLSPDLATIMPLLIKYWRKVGKNPGPEDYLQTREFRQVTKGVLKLKENFEFRQSPDLLDAYILYYWPVHYQQALSILGELPEVPNRVLDVMSGLAPTAFAAIRHGASEVYATDPELDLVTHGANICGKYGMALTARRWNGRGKCPIKGKFDLITISNYFSEELIEPLFDLLTDNGHLVIIDRSDNAKNQQILKFRDHLVNKGYPVLAPCVWKGKCPALKANSVCYAQREYEKHELLKEFQRSASINLGSLKMSYLIFGTPQKGWVSLPDKKYYRIISPPFESHKGNTYYLCGVDGKKKFSTRLDEHPKISRAFEYLKRGELISVEEALSSENQLEIVEDTRVTIEAANGKPIPLIPEFDDEW